LSAFGNVIISLNHDFIKICEISKMTY
jgi:hypothetical protein